MDILAIESIKKMGFNVKNRI
jgi:hypothetical protein